MGSHFSESAPGREEQPRWGGARQRLTGVEDERHWGAGAGHQSSSHACCRGGADREEPLRQGPLLPCEASSGADCPSHPHPCPEKQPGSGVQRRPLQPFHAAAWGREGHTASIPQRGLPSLPHFLICKVETLHTPEALVSS